VGAGGVNRCRYRAGVDTHWTGIILGVALWGVHMGMTQGLLAAMIAKTAPADLRGTAYGIFSWSVALDY
jgi:hypothetical protein